MSNLKKPYKMKVAGTGHRPDKLGGYTPEVMENLVKVAEDYLRKFEEIPVVISGMALGWDQALAQAAINCNCPLHAYVPFAGQEKAWPIESQKYYNKLLEKAAIVHICSAGPYEPWKMQKRNVLMVDHCDILLAMYNGTAGGTENCIKYAQLKKKPVVNLWNQ